MNCWVLSNGSLYSLKQLHHTLLCHNFASNHFIDSSCVHCLCMVSEDCYGFYWDSLVMFRDYRIYIWNCSNCAVNYCSCGMRNEKTTGLNVPQSKGQCLCLAIDLLRYGIQWGLNDAHTVFNLYNPCVFLFLIQTSIFTRQYPTPCLPYLCKLLSCSSCSNLICTSFLIISGY